MFVQHSRGLRVWRAQFVLLKLESKPAPYLEYLLVRPLVGRMGE